MRREMVDWSTDGSIRKRQETLTEVADEYGLNIKIQSVPRSKHSVSVIKTSQLMLYREIIAVCSQIHT